MASGFFGAGLAHLLDPARAASRTLKVMLMQPGYDASYTPDSATVSAISASELASITGYTAGSAVGQANNYAGRKGVTATLSYSTSTNVLTLTFAGASPAASNPVWTALQAAGATNIGGAVIFIEITNDASSIPLAFIDTNNIQTNGQDVTLNLGSFSGTLTLPASPA